MKTPGGDKPIESLTVGDEVIARDERTGETHTRKVTALHKRVATAVLWLTLAVPAEAAPDLHLASLAEPSFKVEQIGTTPEHPFYVEGKGWTPAGALKAGDRIVSLDGPSLEVIALRLDETPATVYNLTVASDASFFVGELGAWGHNSKFDDVQQIVIEWAKWYKKKGISLDDASALVDLGNSCGLPSRGPEVHPGRPHGQFPHVHVGPIDHIFLK